MLHFIDSKGVSQKLIDFARTLKHLLVSLARSIRGIYGRNAPVH